MFQLIDGLDSLIRCLDKLYLKDETCSAYEAYEDFEKFVKPSDMKINDYIIKFEQLYGKAKSHQMEIHDGVLAYRLLNSAGLSESHKQLVRATVPALQYAAMKEQLKKVFINTGDTVGQSPECSVKVEPVASVFNAACSVGDGDHQSGDSSHDCDFCGYSSPAGKSKFGSQFRGRGNRGRAQATPRRAQRACFACGSTSHLVRDCPNKVTSEESL